MLTTDNKNLTILGIGGSTRANSHNRNALAFALQRAGALGAHTECFDLHGYQFPMLDDSLKLEDYPAVVATFLAAAERADGIVLCSPTYHGAMSGAFKNALDLLQYGSDQYFDGKPVGIMAMGGANAASVLDMISTTCQSLKGMVVPNRVHIGHGIVGEDGTITDQAVMARIDRMVSDVINVAEAFRSHTATTEMIAMAGA